ncbi:hypothetical protein HanXRQr2_Chr01g0031081 [Helianthus annuus]|uniref:Uncharacterized protein n=1 Tax=Helianthus annuus TaxID=4232 RepID=A0A9K3JWG3_HELAN|nr:hypothetical protein HanXRQr2_Chr01g0031081 [Helianthus annuus]KAJ0957670.1 hypothetical protein HanPSC8_Chr01g0030371 [Helianthus annuus]
MWPHEAVVPREVAQKQGQGFLPNFLQALHKWVQLMARLVEVCQIDFQQPLDQ